MSEAKIIKDINAKCHFCKAAIEEEITLGEKFKLRDIVVHYYCVLLSYRTPQKGSDEEGLRGFLYADIKREITRNEGTTCEFCGDSGACMQCHRCKIKFHLPCGLIKNIMSQFKGDFRSFCATHRPKQMLPTNTIREAKRNPPTCVVCMELVIIDDSLLNIIWAPCCEKTFYHLTCIQKLALSQGSLFKCAVCSNTRKFKPWVQKFGVFIPERDASWELEPNAYGTLHERHSCCDVTTCLCPYGRTADREGSRWEIVLCHTCGSQGTHVSCSSLKFSSVEWECSLCATISNDHQGDESTDDCDQSRLSESPDPTATAKKPKARRNACSSGGKARRGRPFRHSDGRGRTVRAGSSGIASKTPVVSSQLSSSSDTDESNEKPKKPEMLSADKSEDKAQEESPCNQVKTEPQVDVVELSNSGSDDGPFVAQRQEQHVVQKPQWNWMCVRKKEAPDSDTDTDVEVVEVDDPPAPIKEEPGTIKTEAGAAVVAPPGLPVDADGQPVKFIVLGGTLYEVAPGAENTMTLKPQGPVLQPDLIKSEPAVKVPPPGDMDLVASRSPEQASWRMPPKPPEVTSTMSPGCVMSSLASSFPAPPQPAQVISNPGLWPQPLPEQSGHRWVLWEAPVADPPTYNEAINGINSVPVVRERASAIISSSSALSNPTQSQTRNTQIWPEENLLHHLLVDTVVPHSSNRLDFRRPDQPSISSIADHRQRPTPPNATYFQSAELRPEAKKTPRQKPAVRHSVPPSPQVSSEQGLLYRFLQNPAPQRTQGIEGPYIPLPHRPSTPPRAQKISAPQPTSPHPQEMSRPRPIANIRPSAIHPSSVSSELQMPIAHVDSLHSLKAPAKGPSSVLQVETIDLTPPEACEDPLALGSKRSRSHKPVKKKKKKKKPKVDDDVCFLEERSLEKTSDASTPKKSSSEGPNPDVIEIE